MAKDGSDEAKNTQQEGNKETRGEKGSERSKRRSGGGKKDLSIEAGEAGEGGETQHSGKRKRLASEAGGGPSPRDKRRQSGEGLSPKDANSRKAKIPRGASVSEGGKRMVAAAMGKSGGEGGADEKDVEPPVRVMKNPDFLQEHRDRYKAPHQKAISPKQQHQHQQQQQGKGQQDGGKGGGAAAGKGPGGALSGGGGGAGGEGAPMSNRQRNKDRKFVYGNYDTYYNYRNPGDAQEPRLAVMRKEWFEGKRALDIGCNSGAVTIDIARTMQCRHIMGVDIDKSLVTKARSHLKWKAAGCPPRPDKAFSNSENSEDKAAKSDSSNNNNEGAPPASATTHKGTETRPGRQALDASLPDPDADPFAFPYNCGFRHEDFANVPHSDTTYDTILALSVTKWVHYHNGDEGVKRFFKKIYDSLSEGGVFIHEWQEWSSYKKKKCLTEEIKANCACIELKPDMFDRYLLDEVGFSSALQLDPPDGANKGFSRPFKAYFK